MVVNPQKYVRVGSNKTFEFTITFSPKERVKPFAETIYYRTRVYMDGFCVVKGSAVAPEIFLDRQHLTFGNVVVNFERMINVVLKNTGDVNLK